MTSQAFEAFLARIYADAAAREEFLADPRGVARRAGLSEEECAALDQIDWIGLELAAESLARKRAKKAGSGPEGPQY